MTAGGAGGFGDGVAVGVGHVARSDGALHGLRGLLDVHERGIHQERRDARMDEVGQGLGHIELNTVEQVTAAERVGDDRELVVLAIAQKMRALAARTLGAVLVAGALAHEQAVLGDHELLGADDGKA